MTKVIDSALLHLRKDKILKKNYYLDPNCLKGVGGRMYI